jgi:DNA modification methylase
MTIDLHKGDAIAVTKRLLTQGQRWDYCLTSPLYYGMGSSDDPLEIGHETSSQGYIETLLPLFALILEGMRPEGVLWLNMADTRNNDSIVCQRGRRGEKVRRRKVERAQGRRGSPLRIPERLLERLIEQGWHHAHTYIWAKGAGCSSQPCDGRPQDTHELIYALSKPVNTRPQPLATFGDSVIICPPDRTDFPYKMPLSLARLLLGRAKLTQATVLDPFIGAATTAIAAQQRGFDCIGIDLDLAPASAAVQGVQTTLPV